MPNLTEAEGSANSRLDLAGRRNRRPAKSDSLYQVILYGTSALFALICAVFLLSVVLPSVPAWRASGLSIIFGTKWDPASKTYGALPLIFGTVETTAIALCFAIPIGVGTAIAIVHLIPRRFRIPVSSVVEMLAAVPSVVYGMFGLVVLVPIFQEHVQPWLANLTGGHFPFNGNPEGLSILLAGCVLFVMIVPTIIALSRDVIAAVPSDQIEGALSMGASRWQMLSRVVLPGARSGIVGAVTLATARALGETIAVAMVIGSNPRFANSLFSPGATLASTIATQYQGSTTQDLQYLAALAVILMSITVSANWIARRYVRGSTLKGVA